MRVSARHLALGLVCLAAPTLADGTGLEDLRRDWHRCLRQSFSGQPTRIGRQAAERAALAACKTQEDAVVAGELTAQLDAQARQRDGGGLVARARAALASMMAYVVAPASWIGTLGR